MAYPSGYLSDRLTIRNKVVTTGFGETTGYVVAGSCCGKKIWKSGSKVLREGALDAIDMVIFRMRYDEGKRLGLARDSQICCDGKTYQVLTVEGDKKENQMEVKATEVVK